MSGDEQEIEYKLPIPSDKRILFGDQKLIEGVTVVRQSGENVVSNVVEDFSKLRWAVHETL